MTSHQALEVLGTYLTSSAAAPLNKEYVEIDSPLWQVSSYFPSPLHSHCSHSTYIYFSEDTRTTLCDIPIYVGSVPSEHLDTFDQKLKKSLERIANEGIDMDRMTMVINREERQVLFFITLHFNANQLASFEVNWNLPRETLSPPQ